MFESANRIHSLPRALAYLALGCAVWLSQAGAVSVTSYGAVANDGIDDTTAFNNCLDNNVDVSIPSGVYEISARINVPPNRSFYGTGSDSSAVVLRLNGNFQGIEVGGNSVVTKFTLDRIPANNTTFAIVASGDDIVINEIAILDNRSNAPTIMANEVDNLEVSSCYVRNYGRWSNSQVKGVGIRLSECTNSLITNNDVVELQTFPVGTSNYYQAAGIETSESNTVTVSYNYVLRAGNGLDLGAALNQYVAANWIEDCHEVGIKCVNGTGGGTIEDNTVLKCGLAGIWLSCGNAQPAVSGAHHITVQDNDLSSMGMGVGLDYWDHAVAKRPAGILVEGCSDDPERVPRYNTIRNNTVHRSSQMPDAHYVVEDYYFTYDPYSNTYTGNSLVN